jgi:hypothetical protein
MDQASGSAEQHQDTDPVETGREVDVEHGVVLHHLSDGSTLGEFIVGLDESENMPEDLSWQARIELGPDPTWLERDDSPERLELATEVRKMLMSEPYFEVTKVQEMLGTEDVEGLINDGTILAYRDHGDALFPAFQFDPKTNRPFEVVSRINVMLDAPHDGWGVTGWWVQASGRLPEHPAPKEYLENPDLHDTLIQLAEGVVSD